MSSRVVVLHLFLGCAPPHRPCPLISDFMYHSVSCKLIFCIYIYVCIYKVAGFYIAIDDPCMVPYCEE